MTRYFTEEHEWIEVEGNIATIGITEYAQEQLGDVVFVEVPSAGVEFDKGDDAAVVDLLKRPAMSIHPFLVKLLKAMMLWKKTLLWSILTPKAMAGFSN